MSSRAERIIEGMMQMAAGEATEEARQSFKEKALALAKSKGLEHLIEGWDPTSGLKTFRAKRSIILVSDVLYPYSEDFKWSSPLYSHLAKAFRCQALRRSVTEEDRRELDDQLEGRDAFEIIGTRENAIACAEMLSAAQEIGYELWESGSIESDELASFMTELGRQLAEQVTIQNEKALKAPTVGSELVLYQEDIKTAIEEKIRAEHGSYNRVPVVVTRARDEVVAEAFAASRKLTGKLKV